MQQDSSTVSGKQWRTLNEARARFERRYLIAALRRANGYISVAAKLAGRDRTFVHRLLKLYGIQARDFRPCARRRLCTRSVEPLAPVTPPKRTWFGVPLSNL